MMFLRVCQRAIYTLGTQVEHLSQCMRDVDACSLRFSVYTRDEAQGRGRIVELLNTGMIGIGRLTMMELDAESEDVVLDFEDDVRRIFFETVFIQAASAARERASSGFRLLVGLILLVLVTLW